MSEIPCQPDDELDALTVAREAIEARLRWFESRPHVRSDHPNYVRAARAHRTILRMLQDRQRRSRR